MNKKQNKEIIVNTTDTHNLFAINKKKQIVIFFKETTKSAQRLGKCLAET